MSKLKFLSSILLLAIFFVSCGRAAEDRKAMHERAKSFQDSIANLIRTTMAEAEGPAVMPAPASAVDTSGKAPSKVPTK